MYSFRLDVGRSVMSWRSVVVSASVYEIATLRDKRSAVRALVRRVILVRLRNRIPETSTLGDERPRSHPWLLETTTTTTTTTNDNNNNNNDDNDNHNNIRSCISRLGGPLRRGIIASSGRGQDRHMCTYIYIYICISMYT